eukprot:s419_g7.t1
MVLHLSQEKILDADCDVGVGAAPPLQCLLEKSSLPDRRSALRELLQKVNTSKSASAKHFWKYLAEVEAAMGKRFKHLPLVVKQAQTKAHAMSAATLQVQLCEYRQFRHSWARNVYGLPDDETMRMEESGNGGLRPEDMLSRNKTQVLGELEHEGKQVRFSVSIKDFGSAKVAERVALLMLQKLRSGTKEKDLVKFRDELARDYQHGPDVKEDSEAWRLCKAQMSHSNPLVSFEFKRKDGSKFPFQTTVKAAGHILVAERIARLCWEKLNAGKSKDEVLKFRDGLSLVLTPCCLPAAEEAPEEIKEIYGRGLSDPEQFEIWAAYLEKLLRTGAKVSRSQSIEVVWCCAAIPASYRSHGAQLENHK